MKLPVVVRGGFAVELLLMSLFPLSLLSCRYSGGFDVRRPSPLETTEPAKNPYIYGDGRKMFIFAAVGGNVLDVRRNTGPIVDYLGYRLGVRFRLDYYRHYDGIVAALAGGKADFAWLGPMTYLAVRRRLPCVPVVQILRDGVGYYEGVILVRMDRGYTTVRDLKGKVLAFIDRSSTSGYIYPRYFFRKKGIDVDTFFGKVEFAGSHSIALLRLVNGTYDAICTERDTLRRLSDKVDTGDLQVLTVTGCIPNGPIAAHPRLSRDFIEKAARVAVGMASDPEGARLLKELGRNSNFSGFGPVSESVYDEVAAIVASCDGSGK